MTGRKSMIEASPRQRICSYFLPSPTPSGEPEGGLEVVRGDEGGTVHPASTVLPPRYLRGMLRQGWLQRKKPFCCRCSLPVLTGFTEGSSRRALALIAAHENTDRKKAGLGREFDPTGADCGSQGTAGSPSSTVLGYYSPFGAAAHSGRLDSRP